MGYITLLGITLFNKCSDYRNTELDITGLDQHKASSTGFGSQFLDETGVKRKGFELVGTEGHLGTRQDFTKRNRLHGNFSGN